MTPLLVKKLKLYVIKTSFKSHHSFNGTTQNRFDATFKHKLSIVFHTIQYHVSFGDKMKAEVTEKI